MKVRTTPWSRAIASRSARRVQQQLGCLRAATHMQGNAAAELVHHPLVVLVERPGRPLQPDREHLMIAIDFANVHFHDANLRVQNS